MAAMARLNRIWWCNTISFTNKCKLYKPLITSILLCGCETWTLLADSEEKKRKGSRLSTPSACGNFSASRSWSTRSRPRTEQDQTSFGNCLETETCMVLVYHTPRQLLQNDPSGHLGGWAMPWSAEEMLNRQHQRMDIPAHDRTALQWPPADKTGRGSLLNRPLCLPDNHKSVTGLK